MASRGPGQTSPHCQGIGIRALAPIREYWLRFHTVSRSPEAETSRVSLPPRKASEVAKIGSAPGYDVAGLAGPVAEIRDTWMPPASSDATHRSSRLMARASASRPPVRACPATPDRWPTRPHPERPPGRHVAVGGGVTRTATSAYA